MALFRSLPHLIRQIFQASKLDTHYLLKVLDVQRLSHDYYDLFSSLFYPIRYLIFSRVALGLIQ